MVYRIKFKGRKAGALGVTYDIVAFRYGSTPEEAIERLYAAFENIRVIEIAEAKSTKGILS